MNYFKSLDETTYCIVTNDEKIECDKFKKEDLKLAFGSCYRILDKIALGVLDVLGMDIDSKVDFLNMWDSDNLFDKEFVEINPYLMTLYSIGKDLDRNTKISALSNFKGVRNAIEHKLFFITEKTQKKENNIVYITKKDLTNFIYLFYQKRIIIELNKQICLALILK